MREKLGVGWVVLAVVLLVLSTGPLFAFFWLPLYLIAFSAADPDPATHLIRQGPCDSFAPAQTEVYQYENYIDRNQMLSTDRKWPEEPLELKHHKLEYELNEVIRLVMRDFVYPWYGKLAQPGQSDFTIEVQRLLNHVITQLTERFEATNQMYPYVSFITGDMVKEVMLHVNLYRCAEQQVPRTFRMSSDRNAQELRTNEVRAKFFDLEVEYYVASNQRWCHDHIANSDKQFSDYLRRMTDMMLLGLLPERDFACRPVRHFLREMLVTQMIRPMIENLCSSDFINSCFVHYTPESALTSESFLELVRASYSVEELDAIIAFCQNQIVHHQNNDNQTGQSSGSSVKKQLESIKFLYGECNSRIERLKSPRRFSSFSTTQPLSAFQEHNESSAVPPLSLEQIIGSYYEEFFQFLEKCNASKFLEFYHYTKAYQATVDEVNSYRDERMMVNGGGELSPEEELKIGNNMEAMRGFADHLLAKYQSLSEETPNSVAYNFKQDTSWVKEIKQKLNNNVDLCYDWFDKPAAQVLDFMRNNGKIYHSFVTSQAYIRLMRPEPNDVPKTSPSLDDLSSLSTSCTLEHHRTVSDQSGAGAGDGVRPALERRLSASCSVPTHLSSMSEPPSLGIVAHIINYRISDAGKRHAVYEVSVSIYNPDSKPNPLTYKIFRRYSDFLKLYDDTRKKYPTVEHITFPPKKAGHNLEEKLLRKRQHALDKFLQELMSTELLASNPGLLLMIKEFLERDQGSDYAALAASLSGKMLNSFKKASSVISESVPLGKQASVGSLTPDPVQRATSMPTGPSNHNLDQLSSSGDDWTFGDQDSLHDIPENDHSRSTESSNEDTETFKQLTNLFFEIFDIRGRDTNYIRREFTTKITQLFQATYGNRINKKIAKVVGSYMTEEALAGYVKQQRENFWPGGQPSRPGPPKSIQDKCRTRFLAKAKLYGSVSNEIKNLGFVKEENLRTGIQRLVRLFQDQHLNRRLAIVLLERLMFRLFPDLKMDLILVEAHRASPRLHQRFPSMPS